MWKISPEAIISEFKDIRGIAAKRRDARSVRPCTILTIRMLSRTHEPCVPTLGVIQHLSMLLVTLAIPAGYAATLPCRQIAHRFRKASVAAGRNVIKLRDEVKTLSETRRVGPVLIRVRSVSVARGGW